MTTRLSTGLRNAICGSTGFVGALDRGIIEVRTGTQPASADAAVSGTLLGIITLNGGAFTPGTSTNGLTFAAATAGAVVKSGTWSFTALANGTAGWARFKGNALDDNSESTTLARLDMAVAVTGADLDMRTAIKTGEVTTLDNFSFTVPAQSPFA